MFLERSINQADNIGWIEVICGSMFSGKTEELIRRVKRAKLAKQKVKIFKPKQDTRYSKKKVTSHDNNSIKSKPVNSPEKILELSEKFDIIGIDEAQFFDDSIIDVCNKLANAGKRVIVAGLDMDYRGNNNRSINTQLVRDFCSSRVFNMSGAGYGRGTHPRALAVIDEGRCLDPHFRIG